MSSPLTEHDTFEDLHLPTATSSAMVRTRLGREAKRSEVDYFEELCVCLRGCGGVNFDSVLGCFRKHSLDLLTPSPSERVLTRALRHSYLPQ